MIKKSLIIKNKLGLHTRAAAKLVDLSKKFQSKVEVTYRGRTVNAKSIMGVITLGAQKDSTLEVHIEGDDESDAISSIQKLLDEKFGEHE